MDPCKEFVYDRIHPHDRCDHPESADKAAAYRAATLLGVWFAERFGTQIALPVSTAAVRTFNTDHAQRKVGNGLGATLVSELPPGVDARLVTAGSRASWARSNSRHCCTG